MEHIHGILSALAYSLEIMGRREDSLKKSNQKIFLPVMSTSLSCKSLANIMNVVVVYPDTATSNDGWIHMCALKYAQHPAQEREEFIQVLPEYFETKTYDLEGVFDHLVLTHKGGCIGKQIYEDNDLLFYNLVYKIIEHDKSCDPKHTCGLVYIAQD